MIYVPAFEQDKNCAAVKELECEFQAVWQTLNLIRERTPPSDLLHLEVQRASETLMELMRDAGCEQSSTVRHSSSNTGSPSAGI